LWWRHRSILQQLAAFVALTVTASAANRTADQRRRGAPGLSVWGVAVIWFALGWGGFVTPRRATYVLGGIGALFGAAITMTADWGWPSGWPRQLHSCAWPSCSATSCCLPSARSAHCRSCRGAVSRWFPGALAAPLALLAVGIVLVAAAVYTARRRSAQVLGPALDRSSGSPRVALAVA
jgi:hypothetical protein